MHCIVNAIYYAIISPMEILWQPKATKQLKKIGDRKLRARIVKVVAGLESFPDCQGIKPLTNHKYDYRLRVGDWRILFDLIDGMPVIISIEEVRKRDERTY